MVGMHLFLIMFICTVLIYLINGRKILSVAFLSSATFLISSIFYLIDYEWLGYDISYSTIVFIIASIVSLFLGELLVSSFLLVGGKKSTRVFPQHCIRLDPLILFIFFFLIFVFGVLYFVEVYHYSLSCGNTPGNFFSMVEFVRKDASYSSIIYDIKTVILNNANKE